jgi:hypothetical protein
MNEFFVVVDLTIGNHSVFVFSREDTEGLLPFRREVVNGQAMETYNA